jgi:hypothetical protein
MKTKNIFFWALMASVIAIISAAMLVACNKEDEPKDETFKPDKNASPAQIKQWIATADLTMKAAKKLTVTKKIRADDIVSATGSATEKWEYDKDSRKALCAMRGDGEVDGEYVKGIEGMFTNGDDLYCYTYQKDNDGIKEFGILTRPEFAQYVEVIGTMYNMQDFLFFSQNSDYGYVYEINSAGKIQITRKDSSDYRSYSLRVYEITLNTDYKYQTINATWTDYYNGR